MKFKAQKGTPYRSLGQKHHKITTISHPFRRYSGLRRKPPHPENRENVSAPTVQEASLSCKPCIVAHVGSYKDKKTLQPLPYKKPPYRANPVYRSTRRQSQVQENASAPTVQEASLSCKPRIVAHVGSHNKDPSNISYTPRHTNAPDTQKQPVAAWGVCCFGTVFSSDAESLARVTPLVPCWSCDTFELFKIMEHDESGTEW